MTKPRELATIGLLFACGFVACGKKTEPLPVSVSDLIEAHRKDPTGVPFHGALVRLPATVTEVDPVARSVGRRLRPDCKLLFVVFLAAGEEMPGTGYYEFVGQVAEPDRSPGDRGLPGVAVTIILRDCRARRLD